MKVVSIAVIILALSGGISAADRGEDSVQSIAPPIAAATGVEPPPDVVPPVDTLRDAPRFPSVGGTLDDYVAIAIENNAGLRAAFEDWSAAMERVPQVTALPEPRFEWTHFVEEIQTRTGPQNNRFAATQMIPWLGKLKQQGEASALAAERLWWDMQAKKLKVIRDVKSTYYEYAYLGRAIGIVEENLSLLQALEPIVQRSIQVGSGQGPLLRLQVEIGKLENELRSLQGFRVPVSAQLRAALNIDEPAELPWPELEQGDLHTYLRNDLAEALERINPELQAMIRMMRQADAMAERARLDRYPDFSVGLSYIDTGSAVGDMRPSDSGDDPWGVTVGVSIPIWRKKYDAGVREAQALKRKASHELHQRHFDLQTEVDITLYELEDAARQLHLFQNTLIPRARQALEVTEISYESGGATFLEIIDAQRELLIFEKSYWRFVATYKQRLADLEMICGGPLS